MVTAIVTLRLTDVSAKQVELVFPVIIQRIHRPLRRVVPQARGPSGHLRQGARESPVRPVCRHMHDAVGVRVQAAQERRRPPGQRFLHLSDAVQDPGQRVLHPVRRLAVAIHAFLPTGRREAWAIPKTT